MKGKIKMHKMKGKGGGEKRNEIERERGKIQRDMFFAYVER